jgi:DNA-directed RNA polymerase specialized sigma24 family protein
MRLGTAEISASALARVPRLITSHASLAIVRTVTNAKSRAKPARAKLRKASGAPKKLGMDTPEGIPSIEEVIAYAEKSVAGYLKRFASGLASELKDEIRQNAYVRVVEAFDRFEADRGWKAFVQLHCKGSVLDYLRDGKGFQETGWAAKPTDGDGAHQDRLKTRVGNFQFKTSDEEMFDPDLESFLSAHGIHAVHESEEDQVFKVNWELVSRMASIDPDVHLVGKILLGFTQSELAEGFGVTRERLGQRIRLFFDRLDSPEFFHNRWIKQTIYAFGLGPMFHMDPVDQQLGWNLRPVNLYSQDSVSKMKTRLQLALFQEPEQPSPRF